MRKGPLIVVTAAAGLLVSAYAVKKLLENPDFRAKVMEARDKLKQSLADISEDLRVDRASEESFPASDAPSHTPELGTR